MTSMIETERQLVGTELAENRERIESWKRKRCEDDMVFGMSWMAEAVRGRGNDTIINHCQ